MNPCYSQAPLRCRRSNLHVSVSTPPPDLECARIYIQIYIYVKLQKFKIRKFEIQYDFSTVLLK